MINDLWYKNAVIYCLSVGTYMDSNADGIGDFKGLTRRLDYLHGLGVTAIWLMPFQVSPHRDDGYDVSDYYGVDPRYGTIGDFVEFTKGANVAKPEPQYDMLRAFREFLQWRQGDCIVLAEANVLPETDMEYFGADGDRMHMMFNFQVNQHLFYALAAADVRPLVKAMKATRTRPPTAQWGMFLRNHDELDLGRLDEAQRQKVFEE